MKATMLAHDLLLAGTNKVMVAGGLESMSNAPYLLPKARAGMRMGHGQVIDHMFLDGLEDAYDRGCLMGTFAENTADKYTFTREQQDDFAITSLKRAQAAIESGSFKSEITPVIMKTRKGEMTVDTDEQPFSANLDKIPTLRPAFRGDGTVTAANSSSISDGAAALVLMSEDEAEKRSIKPLAVICGHSSFAHEPAWFTTAPVGAIRNLMEKLDWSVTDVDLFEILSKLALKGEMTVDTDEQPFSANLDKIPTLRPAFRGDGTVTAANSSSISDGAAALVLMSEDEAEKRSIKPLAVICGHSSFAHEPAWFTTAPVGAIRNLMEKLDWSVTDVDLFEINEAFAVVTMAATHDLGLDHAKVNINGGACARFSRMISQLPR